MKLTVDALQAAGAFAGPPVKREITWSSGGEERKADVYIRPLSYQSAIGDIRAIGGDGDIAASRIANSVVDETGQPVFKISDITGVNEDGTPVMYTDSDGEERVRGGMCESLITALLILIGEVNSLGKNQPTTR